MNILFQYKPMNNSLGARVVAGVKGLSFRGDFTYSLTQLADTVWTNPRDPRHFGTIASVYDTVLTFTL